MTAAAVEQSKAGGKGSKGGGIVVPFVRGSHHVYEGPFVDKSQLLGAAAVNLGPYEVPARGFLRHIIVEITATGGVIGAGVLHEDYPYNLLGNVQLVDPGGTPIFGPMAGYSVYLANLLGGYAFESDVSAQPDFVGTINATFYVRIPVEITPHDGFGSLINNNSGAAYKLSFTAPASTDVFTTAPTTPPTVRYRAWLAAWADPPAADPFGNALAQEPVGHGTIQYWTEQSFDIGAVGQKMVKLTRVGNPLRLIAFIYRVAAARSTANIPDPLTFTEDARNVAVLSRSVLRGIAFERYGRAMPAGVVPIEYISDGEGHAGDESRALYNVTFNGSRLEFGGSWGAAGVLTVLTNDLAPVGAPVRPLETPAG